jgi:2,3-diaminopropionate biosynthesis protein SbnA
MIVDRPSDIVRSRIFVRLPGFLPAVETSVKLEGLNPAGSIKLKTARSLVDAAGEIGAGSELIESTSGNLGTALAMICAERGVRITLVTDPNTNDRSLRHMRVFGAQVVVVTERDQHGGFLNTRIEYIKRRLRENPKLVWLNQYANPANSAAHYHHTAREIVEEFGIPDWLFIGVGTSGTLMGCVEYFRSLQVPTTIVAVDALGSVTFGRRPGQRWIPGIGSSRRPELFQPAGFLQCVVAEDQTVAMCRHVAREYGLLLGGSSGAALAAVGMMAVPPNSRVLVISPDMGDRYLETIYDDEWVAARFG